MIAAVAKQGHAVT